MAAGLLIGAVAGLLVGAAVAYGILQRRVTGQDARLAVAERVDFELDRTRDELAMLQAEAGQLREDRARLSEQVSAADHSIAREQARLDTELGRLREAFASQSQVVMEKAVSQLAEMSGRQGEERDRTLRATVAPVSELLARFEQHVHEVEKDRKESYGSISSQVDSLRRSQEQLTVETKNLVTALRRPQTRGRWGELQLRKVVEMAGMTEHCDFDEQPSLRIDDDALQRPDLVVHLPDRAEVVVDAKVPLSAYLDAIEAIDDEVRTQQLRAHANQVRTHVQKLASKEYWRQFQNSPDFVVCFVPGDALLSAAFEADPTLTEYALANKVLLTGPTALIALLQTVSYGWRQERLARNTQEIQQLAEQLYNRLGKFANHLSKLRSSLDRAVGSYNDAVSSLETRLLPTARRLRAVGVGDDDGELAVPRPITTRAVTAGAPELEVQERVAEELDA
ncbi:MAG TPA: DNA recombination protein RmuC [Acidimicrobiales bacterium]|jgi:DNA recombination protein RmuC|nr:DNA recombination protein RmuC [Acidimicrobiales bacterium]